tara:strand:+ start:233 stop:880 length:648 start_codon:yes stop_codon:yes gene_type:complete
MAKKCPPGVICFSNFVFVLLVGLILYVIYYFKTMEYKTTVNSNNHDHHHTHNNTMFSSFLRPNYGYTNLPNDVYLNPYTAPLRDNRYFVPSHDIRGIPLPTTTVGTNIPINISTQAIDTNYRQMGILTRKNNSDETILPLMGRPLFTNRDKWQFYTMNDKNNAIKLPIVHNGRSCTNEYGCDNLYNGDVVRVQGYNDDFNVTVYDNAVMRYLPFV